MKKIIAFALCLTMMLSLCGFAYASEIGEDDYGLPDEVAGLLGETGYVLVEDGVPRSITEEEYHVIVDTEVVEPIQNQHSLDIQFVGEDGISPYSYDPVFFYEFEPTGSVKKYLGETYRVAAVYTSADTIQMEVTNTHTESRTVTETGGVEITTEIRSRIYAGISANYSYATSATSSTSQSITGVFKPNYNCTYSTVVFQPRVVEITGNLNYYQSYQATLTLLHTYTAKAQYPATINSSSSILDGIYSVKAADNANSL